MEKERSNGRKEEVIKRSIKATEENNERNKGVKERKTDDHNTIKIYTDNQIINGSSRC